LVRYSETCIDSARNELTETCRDVIFIPTAFSPNGDGINDVWQVLGGPLDFFECTITDRWDCQLYHSNKPNAVWAASDVPEGVYGLAVRYRNWWRGLHAGAQGHRAGGAIRFAWGDCELRRGAVCRAPHLGNLAK